MSSIFFISLCCLGALIIHLWFYSDFFAYYVKIFKFLIPSKIYNWLLIEDFLRNKDPNLNFDNYIEYIFIKKYFTQSFLEKFFLKLFSCVLCFTTWIALIFSLIMNNLLLIGLFFVTLRILDFILRYVLKKSI
jgi:hypothetical protein